MSARSARRVFWFGLAASVMLHAGLLSSGFIRLPTWADKDDGPPPLEARLELPALAQPAVLPEPPPQPARPPAPHPSVPAPTPTPSTVTESPVPTSTPLQPPPPSETSVPETPPVASPAAVPVEPVSNLNKLPRRIDIEYRVSYGPASGKQTLLWVNEGERYTITSVVAASGLTSIFYSGRFVQTSRGRITAFGLQPEEFWDQRGEKRSQSRFDYDSGTILTETSKGPRNYPMPETVQDVQSLLFQIALTAPPQHESQNTVFNGKKVRTYRYRVMGEEIMETPLGELRTLHMVRVTGSDEGRFEIWLAVDRHYLPVRVLRTEESGVEGELMAVSINSVD